MKLKKLLKSIMKSLLQHGRNILETEVTNISSHGLWILSNGKEYFLSYEQFPWFKDKTINDITHEIILKKFYKMKSL